MNDPALILPVIAPEFDGVDASDVLDIADMQIGAGLCGDKRPMLVAYLAAHILTISKRAGVSGGVSALSEGQLSINYGGSSEGLHATSYGAEYDRLSKGCTFAARTRATYA